MIPIGHAAGLHCGQSVRATSLSPSLVAIDAIDAAPKTGGSSTDSPVSATPNVLRSFPWRRSLSCLCSIFMNPSHDMSLLSAIHQSAWKGYSPKLDVRFTGFSEVRIASVQQPRTSKRGAVCTGAMPRKFPNLVHLGDALTPFWP